MVFNIQRTFRLSDCELGVVLALAIAVAGASSAVMGHLANRVGARRLLWIALLAWSVLLVRHERGPPEVGLRRRARPGRDRRGQHRHRHERRGLAPADRATGRARPISRALQRGRHRRRGGGRDRAARRHLVALDLARRRRGGAGGRAVDVYDRSRGRALDAAEGAAVADRCTRSSASGATASSSCLPSSPWPRSPKEASTRGASSTCATTWPPGCCSGPAPTSSASRWPPRPEARGARDRAPLGPPRPRRGRLRGRGRDPPRIALAVLEHGRTGVGPRRRRRLALLAPRDEQREPIGQPGGQRRGGVHRRRLHRLGGRCPHRGVGLAGLRSAARIAGAGRGGIRGRTGLVPGLGTKVPRGARASLVREP
jgi:hypothetical protein